jgi:hypothetical protein
MQALYQPYFDRQETVTEGAIARMQAEAASVLRTQMVVEFGMQQPNQLETLGYAAATEQVLVTAVHKLLERDARRAPFKVLKLETGLSKSLYVPIQIKGKDQFVRLNGKFDRVDVLANGRAEVVDFKTGAQVKQDIKSLDELFMTNAKEDQKEAFQIMTYAWQLAQVEKLAEVRPTVVRVGTLFSEKLAPEEDFLFTVEKRPVTDMAPLATEWSERWTTLLEEIFDDTVPFAQTSHLKTCQYWSFAGLCHRA